MMLNFEEPGLTKNQKLVKQVPFWVGPCHVVGQEGEKKWWIRTPRNKLVSVHRSQLRMRKGLEELQLEKWGEEDDINDFTAEMMHYDSITYLPDDILVKVDRAAMANSLETRAPFLNHKLVSFAFNIPTKYKLRKKNKIILRDILSNYLPNELFDLPKAGFGMPLDLWLKNELKEWSLSLINKNDIELYGYLNHENIKSIFDEHFNGYRNWNNKIWTVLMFQSWLKNNV